MAQTLIQIQIENKVMKYSKVTTVLELTCELFELCWVPVDDSITVLNNIDINSVNNPLENRLPTKCSTLYSNFLLKNIIKMFTFCSKGCICKVTLLADLLVSCTSPIINARVR